MGANAYTRPGEDEQANTRRATPTRDTPHMAVPLVVAQVVAGSLLSPHQAPSWPPSQGSSFSPRSLCVFLPRSCAVIFSVHWKPPEALPGIAKPQKWPLVLKTAVTPASNTPQDKWVSQIFLSNGDSLVPCTSARLTQWSGRFSPGAPFLATPRG